MNKKYIYLSLSGYYNDIQAREERERYLGRISNVMETLKPLETHSEHFKDLRKAFQSLHDLIETFSEKFAKGFGPVMDPAATYTSPKQGSNALKKRAKKIAKKAAEKAAEKAMDVAEEALIKEQEEEEVVQESNQEVAEAAVEEAAATTGGAEEDPIAGGDVSLPQINRISYSLEKAKEHIIYQFRTAKILGNFKKFGKEHAEYSRDYGKMRADAVASAIDKVIRAKKEFNNKFNEGDTYDYAIKSASVVPDDKEKRTKAANEIKTLRNRMYDAEIKLYQTAEAIDEYMRVFTDAITSNPDDLRSIVQILEQTEVISKWYNNKSGDLLCEVFENFPGSYNANSPKYSNYTHKDVAGSSGHYYEKIQKLCFDNAGYNGIHANRVDQVANAPAQAANPGLPGNPFLGTPAYNDNKSEPQGHKALESAKKALESVSMLKNLVAAFIAIGDKFGGKTLSAGIHVSPIQIYKNLTEYMACSAFTMGINEKARIHGHYHRIVPNLRSDLTVGTATTAAAPSPYVRVDLDNHGLRKGDRFILSVTVDNTLNGEYTVIELPDSTVQNQLQDKDHFYFDSKVNRGFREITGARITILKLPGPERKSVNDTKQITFKPALTSNPPLQAPGLSMADNNHFRMGITAGNNAGGADVEFRRAFSMFMRAHRIQDVGGDVPATELPFNEAYMEPDRLFVMIVKSMVAKIMTTIGVYNMFNKPINSHGLGYFSHMRFILGGADKYPTVIPEAMELYLRLPLLAEFYRHIFEFTETSKQWDNQTARITMVPEMEGTFSGLIQIIFDRARYVKDGTYPTNDVMAMVEEMNKIYMRFKGSKNPVTDAIDEFIAEVNRRYGIVKDDDVKAYEKMRSERYASRYETIPTDREITDFELAGIDEDDLAPRPAPSTSYQTESGATSDIKLHKYELGESLKNHTGWIRKLRNNIDKLFRDTQVGLDKDPVMPENRRGLMSENPANSQKMLRRADFSNIIRARKEELRSAKTEKDRFDVVTNLINGFGTFSLNALENSYLAFHETVVVGLNTLSGMYEMLHSMDEKVNDMYMLLVNVDKWLNGAGGTPQLIVAAGAAGAAGALLTSNNITTAEQRNYLLAAVAAGGTVVKQYHNAAGTDITVADLHIMISNVAPADQTQLVKDFVKRFVVDQSKLMLTLFECLYGHSVTLDKLVDLRIDSSEPGHMKAQLDHSKLREHIISVFNYCKRQLDQYRGLLPKEVIEKYEQASQKGSLYWLEDALIDKLLHGKHPPQDITDKLERDDPNDNLDRLNVKVNHILEFLSRDWGFNAGAPDNKNVERINPATLGKIPAAGNIDYTRHEFYRDLARLNFFDYTSDNPIEPNQITPDNAEGLTEVLLNRPLPAAGAGGTSYITAFDGDNFGSAIANTNSPQWQNNNKNSVWMLFNRLVSLYLHQFYDSTNKKIYLGTLSAFAINGSFSSAVMGNKSFLVSDDTIHRTNNPIDGGDRGGVLLRELGLIMRQLLNEKVERKDQKLFLESDLAEVPFYMKEKYKSSLPIFVKMFSLLKKRCDVIMAFTKGLNAAQPVALGAGGTPVVNVAGQPGNIPEMNDRTDAANTKNWLATLAEISGGCNEMVQCCKDVLDEVNDDPKYLEVKHDSFKDYENQNGMIPFTPYSSSLYYLQNANRADMDYSKNNAQAEFNTSALPLYQTGEARMKMQYGTRGLLHSENISLDQAPGLKHLLNSHNANVDERFKVDMKDTDRFFQQNTQLLQYLVNAKKYRALYSLADNVGTYTHADEDLIGDDKALNTDGNLLTWSLQDSNNTKYAANLVQMTESPFQKEEKHHIVLHTEQGAKSGIIGSRKDIMVYNIIDLNVVPINIHALMREVPLVNLINYEWTFDKFIEELLGLGDITKVSEGKEWDSENAATLLEENHLTSSPATARKLLGWMLIKPYLSMDAYIYDAYLPRIMRGDVGIEGLGRPRYLSDEVYNKSLFGEIYTSTTMDEAGSGVADGVYNSYNYDHLISLLTVERNRAGAHDVAKLDQLIDALKLVNGHRGPQKNRALLDRAGRLAAAASTAGMPWNDNTLEAAAVLSIMDAQRTPNSGSSLNYMKLSDNDGSVEIQRVDIGDKKSVLQLYGRMRFDTTLVRNITWLTNIQRILRLKLRRDLMYYDSKVVNKHAIIAPSITEFHVNDILRNNDEEHYRY